MIKITQKSMSHEYEDGVLVFLRYLTYYCQNIDSMYGIFPVHSVLSNTTIQHIFVPDEFFPPSDDEHHDAWCSCTWWSARSSFHLCARHTSAVRNHDAHHVILLCYNVVLYMLCVVIYDVYVICYDICYYTICYVMNMLWLCCTVVSILSVI